MRVGKTIPESLTKFEVTADLVRERFEYKPLEGTLTYRKNQPPFGLKGASAIFFNSTVRSYQVSIKARCYPAARLIWLYTLGELPLCQIMFRDGNPKNLKWENLVKISDNPTHLPSQEELRKFFTYDTQTGKMLWIFVPYYIRRVKVGDPFGCLAKNKAKNLQNYIGVVNGHHKPLTHIIWCYMTGNYPKEGTYIDHKDRNPSNNSWQNLRLATPQENTSNQADRQLQNRKYLLGVDGTQSGKFQARCMFKGVLHKGRLRLTQEEAHQDYIELHKKLHGEFSNYR